MAGRIKKIIWIGCFIILILGLFFAIPIYADGFADIPEGYYRIKSQCGRYLAVNNGNIDSGARIVLSNEEDDLEEQIFQIIKCDGGYYIQSIVSKKYWGIYKEGLRQYGSEENNEIVWNFQLKKEGTYHLVSSSGKVLCNQDNRNDKGAGIGLKDADDRESMFYLLEEVEGAGSQNEQKPKEEQGIDNAIYQNSVRSIGTDGATYMEWFGVHDEWSVMYILYILEHSMKEYGFSDEQIKERIPHTGSSARTASWFMEQNAYYSFKRWKYKGIITEGNDKLKDYHPQIGDIAFLKYSSRSHRPGPDTVALIYTVEDDFTVDVVQGDTRGIGIDNTKVINARFIKENDRFFCDKDDDFIIIGIARPDLRPEK